MSIVETNITIDSNGKEDMNLLVSQINELLRNVNGKESQVNMTDMDDPISNNPINYRVGG